MLIKLKDRQKLTPLLGNRATEFFQTIEDFAKLKPNLRAEDLLTKHTVAHAREIFDRSPLDFK